MNKHEFLSKLSSILVTNNWDFPPPGRELDLGAKYHGPDKEVREKIKSEGRKLTDSPDTDSKLIGYGLEAYGHYYLSLETAINQNRQHPRGFDEYFSHWLHSDPSYVPTKQLNVLKKWFPKPKSIKIEKGKKCWKYRA